MSCDLIVAGDDAQFGQPEIKLGVMPGAGGTQRLTRAIGKAKAMELILTGRTMPAAEAEAAGPRHAGRPGRVDARRGARRWPRRIAAQPPLAVLAAKQAILRAHELPLSAGLDFERRAFFLLFASDDQTEGMAAFVEKRPPRLDGALTAGSHGGRTMEREPQGGSDFGQDLARDAGEEPGALRDAAPDLRAPIDESAPVSGHVVGPASSGSIAETPEHDWSAAERIIFPALRPVGTQGLTATDVVGRGARRRRDDPPATRSRSSTRARAGSRSSTRSTPAASTSSSTPTTSSRGA